MESLNSLKGGYIGIIWGTTMGGIEGGTRSLDYGLDESRKLKQKLEGKFLQKPYFVLCRV